MAWPARAEPADRTEPGSGAGTSYAGSQAPGSKNAPTPMIATVLLEQELYARSASELRDDEVGAEQDQGSSCSLFYVVAPALADPGPDDQAELRGKERLEGNGGDHDGDGR